MNRKIFLFLQSLLLFLTILLTISNSISSPLGIELFSEQMFTADFTKFKIGDFLPKKYKNSEYAIKQWKLRNLPSPNNGTHWIYIGEHYVLITNKNARISKIYNRDIFYYR